MNKLLKYILVLLFVICAGYRSYAQYYPAPPPPQTGYNVRNLRQAPDPENRILKVKERFIRRQLQLTPEEASKFVPLYHEYQMELFNMQRLKRQNNSRVEPNGRDQVNRDFFYETQIIKIKQRFNDDFLKVLPPEKVSELYKSEREFNDELVRSLSERNMPR